MTELTSSVKAHPACDILPMMTDTEFAELKADIEANGLQEPVVFLMDLLLDGRNRWLACEALGIKPKRTVLKEVDVPSPVQWVLSRNVNRRHLSSSQRSVVAAKAMPMVEGEARRRKIEGNRAGGRKSKRGSATKSTAKNENTKLVAKVPPTFSVKADLSVTTPEKKPREPKTRDVVAKAVGVSGRSVQKAKVVIEGGSKDLVASVESGELTVSLAQKLVKSGASKPRQNKLLEKGVAAIKEYVANRDESDPLHHERLGWKLVIAYVDKAVNALDDYNKLVPNRGLHMPLVRSLQDVATKIENEWRFDR